MKLIRKITLLLLLVGGIWWSWTSWKKNVENSEQPQTSQELRPSQIQSSDDVQVRTEAPVVNPEEERVRSETATLIHEVVQLLLERKATHMPGFNRSELDRETRQNLKGLIKETEIELTNILKSSPAARAVYAQMLLSETDPYVKSGMLKAVRRLDPAYRAEFGSELAKSENPEDRKLAAQDLAKTNDPVAFSALSALATSDTQTDVQSEAAQSLARFGLEDRNGHTYLPQIHDELRALVQGNYDARVRESAFRGLISRGSLSDADREMISQVARSESDPQLRELAESTEAALARRPR